jgi:hypothetical protein
MLTTTSKFPKEIQSYFMCKLLHNRKPIFDGTYRYDEIYKKEVPNIKWVCDLCDKM